MASTGAAAGDYAKHPVEDPKITQKDLRKKAVKKAAKKSYKRLEASFCLIEWEKTPAGIGSSLLPVFDVFISVWHVNSSPRVD